jgi:hypothetical protein
MRGILPISLLVILCVAADLAEAQQRSGSSSATARPSAYDPLLAWATVWGDAEHTGVYTCEEWKRYANKLFSEADRNHDGYVDATEFKTIQQADAMLKGADLGYFDDNHDGRLSRSEFVDKPNPFFARYDRKGACRVTLDDLANPAPSGKTRDGRGGR